MTQHTTVGVPAETATGERRVALVPKVVERIVGKGLRVVVEPGAGAAALIADDAYVARRAPRSATRGRPTSSSR